MRSILRNKFKKKQGNNRIAKAWRKYQQKKYGFFNHLRMVHRCDPRKRRTIQDSYYQPSQ